MTSPGGTSPQNIRRRLDVDGYSIVPAFASATDLRSLAAALNGVSDTQEARARETVYAIRSLLQICPNIQEWALSEPVIRLVEAICGSAVRPVRGLLFDKTPDANWIVPWHQDLTICVKSKRDAPGFGPWSIKAGRVHVQPPYQLLEEMLTLRLHLDDADAENGALRVLPGTHAKGRLTNARISEFQSSRQPVLCSVPRGGVLFMRPLLVHASSAAKNPENHRRVIHIDYAPPELPFGLEWD